MSEWITDRLPTLDDADSLGYVWIWVESIGGVSEFYGAVRTGTPWAQKCPPPPYVKPRWKPKEGETGLKKF